MKAKHVVALLLALVLGFVLTACAPADNKAKDTKKTEKVTTVEETAKEESKSEESKAEETSEEAKEEVTEEESKEEESKEEESKEEKAEETTEESKEEKSEEADAKGETSFEGRNLNVVTTSESYKVLFDAFAEKTGAKVEFLSMSSGEVISRVKAEGGKPMADLWFGGGLDAFLAAKADDLLEKLELENMDGIRDDYRDADGYWLSKGITVGGFIVNNDVLKEKKLDAPKTWKDLADPKYKDELIMSNPAVSGTNYAVVKGLLDHFGEEEGWKLIEAMNANIQFYGKRGKDPQEKTVAGEFAIGIIPVDNGAFEAAKEHNCTVIYPEDAIPWVPEGIAVFKNAENADVAKAFIEFMLEDENLQTLAELDGKDPAQMVKEGLKGFDLGLPADKLVKEDLSTFGTEREAILEKFLEIAGQRVGE